MNDKTLTNGGDLPAVSNPITPAAMLSMALARGDSIETLRELMALQREWLADQARRAFEAAMAAAAGELPPILKSKTVDFTSAKGRTRYRHEGLDDVVEAVRPVLAKHGLNFRFRVVEDNDRLIVTCRVMHEAGHGEECSLSAPRDESGQKNYIQSKGSTITYLQRYTLKAALGLAASADDDGKAATADLISDEQAAQIAALVGALADQTALSKVLRFAQVDALPKIKAQDFQRVLGWLRAKKQSESEPSRETAP
jgi:hypothetical protein